MKATGMTIHAPATEAEAASIVAEARARKTTLAIAGGGSRAGLGRPVEATATLSTRALTGVTLYEPAEMVFSARAGTPLAEIEAMLAEKSQMLPFEPMDHRALLGASGEPTIGGLAACNASGPRRIQAGAARDHFLGVRFVNGRGEIIKSGGRVMKNVTGLDLVKINCGAHGTLGLLTEVTFKALPRPPAAGTLVFDGLDDARAVACMSAALGSPFEVSAAAHLPAWIDGVARTCLRIEHFPDSVDYRLAALSKLLADYGKARRLDGAEGAALWRDIRDVQALASPADAAVWRVSLAPSRAPGFVAAVRESLALRALYDWGGGLVWLACAASGYAGAGVIRAALGGQGHATLVRAPEAVRAAVDVFVPLAAPVMRLTKGIKASFDPDRALNPGRMYAGV